MKKNIRRGTAVSLAAGTVAVLAFAGAGGASASSAQLEPPAFIPIIDDFADYWTKAGEGEPKFAGTVLDGEVLRHNDRVVTWINNNTTGAGQATVEPGTELFEAMQDTKEAGGAYDISYTIGTGLGQTLGSYFIEGRQNGSLPLTSEIVNTTDGAGAFIDFSGAKEAFDYPRPFLPSAPNDVLSGDCEPYNAHALFGIREGEKWAANGNLDIELAPDVVDDTGQFTAGATDPQPVPLTAEYDNLCDVGSFPSGHSANASLSGIALATLLPELAPEILARASEVGTHRMALGVHYPLDVIGGRLGGEQGLAALWSDEQVVAEGFEPARAELVAYLEKRCGNTLATCIAEQTAAGKQYSDDPFGGASLLSDDGRVLVSAEQVTDRASAAAVYTERLTYGFHAVGQTGLPADVPAGAAALLMSSYPTLTQDQRSSILAQTQIESGYPLDQTGQGSGSWQRLDLAAAMSARVQLNADASVTVLATGVQLEVVPASSPTPTPTPTPTPGPGGKPRLPIVSG